MFLSRRPTATIPTAPGTFNCTAPMPLQTFLPSKYFALKTLIHYQEQQSTRGFAFPTCSTHQAPQTTNRQRWRWRGLRLDLMIASRATTKLMTDAAQPRMRYEQTNMQDKTTLHASFLCNFCSKARCGGSWSSLRHDGVGRATKPAARGCQPQARTSR